MNRSPSGTGTCSSGRHAKLSMRGRRLSVMGIFAMTAAILHRPIKVAALSSASKMATKRIAVIGGGASGIFSAISAAEHFVSLQFTQRLEVVVLEATSKTLTKVAISGGGRCNGTWRRGECLPSLAHHKAYFFFIVPCLAAPLQCCMILPSQRAKS
jgi:HI0933-like protein